MHQKLTDLLQSFSSAQWRGLEKFLLSPYFNENEQVAALFQWLRQSLTGNPAPDLKPEAAFAHLFPGQVYQKQAVDRLSSQLFKYAEQFLAVERFTADEFAQDLQLLEYYQESLQDRLFQAKLRQLNKLQEGRTVRDIQFLRRQSAIEQALASWSGQRDQRTGDINLQRLNEWQDRLFLAEKLRLLNHMIGRSKVVQLDYELTWLEALLENLSQQDLEQWPLLDLYSAELTLQKTPADRSLYAALKAKTETHAGKIPDEDLRGAFAVLENSAKKNFRLDEYLQELFDLYTRQLELGLFFSNGKIHHTVFHNIVALALNLGRFEWAESFLEENRRKVLPLEMTEAFYLQNKAEAEYHRGNYGKALELLQKANPDDVYYKLKQKSLLAVIYYELREWDALDNFLNTFSKFIFDQQRKIAADKVASYRLFLNAVRKLFRLATGSPETMEALQKRRPVRDRRVLQALSEWRTELTDAPVFYGKKWLLDKLAELTPPDVPE
ncbi:MAG: hypothetical protein H6562_17860 [Lewinellaceae bacterium]|nr:hypothetical protein [Lewinellaceae bacterium]